VREHVYGAERGERVDGDLPMKRLFGARGGGDGRIDDGVQIGADGGQNRIGVNCERGLEEEEGEMKME
jgi:hypothetical protein